MGDGIVIPEIEKLQEEAGAKKSSKLNQLFSTHPDLDARIQRMEERATSEGIENLQTRWGKQGNKWFQAMWIIHIIEGVRFNGGHPLLFWEIFCMTLSCLPAG